MQVNDIEVEKTKTKIRRVLEDALKSEIISKPEFDGMCPDDKVPGRFYCNFKIHKEHEHMKPPPVRPITSGSGSLTEGQKLFLEENGVKI